MTGEDRRTWAYGLTVAGGALILSGSLVMLLMWWLVQGGGWTGPWWMPGHAFMFQGGFPFVGFVLWGLLAGALVLWSGVRMRPGGPGEGTMEGILAIVGGVLSFPAMAGFMLGALFGVLGGAFSLASAAGRAAES